MSELRDPLRKKLPEYMIPAAFVTLQELPRTPNGKVDRRALPAPEMGRVGVATLMRPPRTPTEEVLVGIWVDVLGIDRVGIHDNFFDLGGHSLLATQAISRVRTAFKVDLPFACCLKRLRWRNWPQIEASRRQGEREDSIHEA